MLESAAQHLSENTVGAHTGEFDVVVQLVSTLFELAAAVTNIAAAGDDDEAIDLDRLHEHAMTGLKMIGAAEVDYDEVDA